MSYLIVDILFAPLGRDVRRQMLGELHGAIDAVVPLAWFVVGFNRRWNYHKSKNQKLEFANLTHGCIR